MAETLLDELRGIYMPDVLSGGRPELGAVVREFAASDVAFVTSNRALQKRYYDAVSELFSCIKPMAGPSLILQEGGVYFGCWLESTGTINAELLSRFIPSVSQSTYSSFARFQREDGLFPYKITADGPVFSQIQLVTPLARCVWNHYALNGRDKNFLAAMYRAMAAYDAWIARYRDTRGSGAVEAFCAFDTGHDLSARFWHIPDTPAGNDPTAYRSDNPLLPLIAPDLTANIVCQRFYLARIAEELGEDGAPWREKAEASLKALFEQCYDQADGFFYDRDRNGRMVKVQSDVLLRVLACEVGDDTFFTEALRRYLLNTRKFFAKYPFTSLALDDPRFDPAFDYNSWCGPSNFLSLIRAPHAFEYHGRHVELTWVLYPILSSLSHSTRFSQTVHPFTGRDGFTETYSPSILCMLDFVERLCGILPRADGTLWFTGLVPYQIEHRDAAHETAYRRRVDGNLFELVNTSKRSTAYRNSEWLYDAPKGVRLVTTRDGDIKSLIGMSVEPVNGVVNTPSGGLPFQAAANDVLTLENGVFSVSSAPGLVPPSF